MQLKECFVLTINTVTGVTVDVDMKHAWLKINGLNPSAQEKEA
jgi:hypothetical protein